MKPTVTFDQHSADYAANWQSIDRELRENNPVAWTQAHDGFWIVSRYADVKRVLQDWETFSSENDISGTGNGGKGILIPRNTFQFALSESDPPQATTLRNFETPFFIPSHVKTWEAATRKHANEAIDAVISSGKIEFSRDFCIAVPAKTVMEFAGISTDQWEVFALSAHDMARMPTNHPDYPLDKIKLVQELLVELVHRRRQEPLNDIASVIANGVINGAVLSDEMAVGVLSAITFGGFDTGTTTALNALLLLDEKPELRDEIKADPKKMAALFEEVLRMWPPSHGFARTATKDVDLDGQRIRAGERVYLLLAAANRDPAKFERPEEFWLDRPNAGQHLTFGFGTHRCLGSLFAKMELGIMLQVVLERIGDYHIVRDGVQRNPLIGTIDGYMAMPARFRPVKNNSAPAISAKTAQAA